MRRNVVRLVFALILGALFGLLAIGLTPGARGEVGPGSLELRASVGAGHTVMEFPPLGSVEADTHDAPLNLDLSLRELDLQRVQDLIVEDETPDALYSAAEEDLRRLAQRFGFRLVVAGGIAGALGAALAPGRRWVTVGAGMVGGLTLVVAVLGLTWRDFDTRAFEEGRYQGAIERAPQLIQAVERHVDDFDDIRERIGVLSRQIGDLYATAAGAVQGPETGDTLLLHVSDLHSNPLGAEIVAEFARELRVDAVLDTGDITSFGIPIEAEIAEVFSGLDVPYLFVPGNHDSPEVRAALATMPHVQVLDGTTFDVEGVRILGVADPTFTATNETDAEEAAEIRLAQAPRVAALLGAHDPAVLAVHDHRMAARASGHVPLVVSGHFHKDEQAVRDRTLFLTVGSAGATGLGSFTVEAGEPYRAEVLHFREGCLTAIDSLAVAGIKGDFRLRRQVVEPNPLCERSPDDRGGDRGQVRVTRPSSRRGTLASRADRAAVSR